MKLHQNRSIHAILWIVLVFSLRSSCAKVHEPHHHSDDRRELTQLPSTCNGTFYVVMADQPSSTPFSEVVLGIYVNGSTIDVGPFNDTPISIVVLCQGIFSYVTMKYRDSTIREFFVPYALKGNIRNNYKKESDLNVVGAKSILVKGYKNSRKIVETSISFNIIKLDSRPPTTSPSRPPTTSPSSPPTSSPSPPPTTSPSPPPTTSSSPQPPKSFTSTLLFTTSTDFKLGSQIINFTDVRKVSYTGRGINVNSTNDQIQLNSAAAPFEFLWVTRNQNILKIDTNTGAILGEYRTMPDSDFIYFGYFDFYPDNKVTDHDGSIWLVKYGTYDGDDEPLPYSLLVHFGLKENNQCEDRNNNGVIDTSSGFGDVKNWTVAGSADDECIIHYVRFNYIETSFIASDVYVNDNNDIWVKDDVDPRNLVLIKGGGPSVSGVGTIMRYETGGLQYGYEGGPISGEIMWAGTDLLRRNATHPLLNLYGQPASLVGGSSGYCMDKQGNIWLSWRDYGIGQPLSYYLLKFDANGKFLGQYLNDGKFEYSEGCVVDAREGGTNDVWIARSTMVGCEVEHLKNDGTSVGIVNNLPVASEFRCSGRSLSISVDGKGKIWIASENSNFMYRINPELGELVNSTHVGAVDLKVDLNAQPYFPFPQFGFGGDMTGGTLRSAPTAGNWLIAIVREYDEVTYNCYSPSTTISWNASVPANTTLTVIVSSINDGILYSAPETVVNGSYIYSINAVYYYQIQILLQRENYRSDSPILYDLKLVTTYDLFTC